MSENNTKSIKQVFKLEPELIENIEHLIGIQAVQSLKNIFLDIHPADIAEIINHLQFEKGLYLFRLLDTETAGDVLTEVDENIREKLLEVLGTSKISEIVDELETDDATDIIADLPEDVQQQVLDNIDEEDSADVKELLKYPEDTAGGIMSSDFVFVYEEQTIDDAIEKVRENADEFEHIYHVYVLTREEKLIGFVLLKSLLIFPGKTSIKKAIEEDLIYVYPETDQEEVARVMEKYDLVALPVVDHKMKMLGRITIDDIVDVIHEEASEDIQKIAGVTEEEEASDTIFSISRGRLPWLFVSLFGEMVSALILSTFHASLEQFIIASFFIPVIMALGGSSGNQAAIITVRAISTGNFWPSQTFKKLLKEFGVANINAFALGSVLLLASFIFFSTNIYFSILLFVTLVIILNFATIIGAAIPIFLNKVNIDPAIATGPFVATMNDIFGLLIYLSLVTIFFS